MVMMNQSVGRIVDFPKRDNVRLYDCPQCPEYRRRIAELEDAIREHQRAKEAARNFSDDAAADLRIWAVIGL